MKVKEYRELCEWLEENTVLSSKIDKKRLVVDLKELKRFLLNMVEEAKENETERWYVCAVSQECTETVECTVEIEKCCGFEETCRQIKTKLKEIMQVEDDESISIKYFVSLDTYGKILY